MEVATQRLSAGYGRAGIRSSQLRRWRETSSLVVVTVSYHRSFHCRTCFWAGDTFAPKLRVRDGVPVQRFLQDAFLDMWEAVARAIGDLDGVLGFEVRSCPLFLSDLLT